MNRRKKIYEKLKKKDKKANEKLQKSNKPKYISKAERAKRAFDGDEVSSENDTMVQKVTL